VQAQKDGLNAHEAMLKAGPIRLRPIMMTSAATMMAAVPPALALGPGSETRGPMAIAIIGGIIVSTMLSLVVVPAFFVVADRMMARPIVDGLPDPRAEVAQAVEHEWGLTLEDVLRRRTQVALLDDTSGGDVAGDVAGIMASRLGWTREAAEEAVRRYLAATSGARARWR
jgi:hypothetical protein